MGTWTSSAMVLGWIPSMIIVFFLFPDLGEKKVWWLVTLVVNGVLVFIANLIDNQIKKEVEEQLREQKRAEGRSNDW